MWYSEHATMEFRAAGWTNENGVFDDVMQEAICADVSALLELFAEQGHSGSSAPYAIQLFEKLARFEPIVPLTGEDFEWNKVGENMWQNNRCSHVFKGADGQAYDSIGRVFCDPDGCCYTSIDSRVPVTFPYTPKVEYVDVGSDI